MENCGIYIRKSREGKNTESKSLQEQELLGKEFCKANNLKPIIYNDGVVSGAGSIEKRTQYSRMLEDIKNNKLHGIYIWETSRLAREEIQWQILVGLLKKHNVRLFDNGTLIDFKKDANMQLFYSMKSSMDAHFARVTSSKIKAVLHRKADKGQFSGILKYGYMRGDDGSTIINPEEAEVVKMMYRLYNEEGLGYRSIADRLNELCIPTRYNKIGGTYQNHKKKSTGIPKVILNKEDAKWAAMVVKKIITSRNYIGEKTYNEKLITIPRIINDTVFNKAEDIRTTRRNKSGKRVIGNYLLNDLLICKECERRYTGRAYSRKYFYYRCSSKIKTGSTCINNGVLTNVVDSFVWGTLFIADGINNLILIEQEDGKINDNGGNKGWDNKLKTSIEEAEALEKQLDKLLDLMLEDENKDKERYKKRERTLESKLSDIKLTISEIESNISIANSSTDNITDFNNSKKEWGNDMKFDEKQSIIRKYISSIKVKHVKDDYLELIINFDMAIGEVIFYLKEDKWYRFSDGDFVRV